MSTVTHSASADAHASQRLYRAVWRWHFYAGLYVVPFLLMMATTGFFMLLFTTYLPEYGDRLRVSPAGEAKPATEIVSAALASLPAGHSLSEFIQPYDSETPALVKLFKDGVDQVVAVDPYRGTVLSSMPAEGTWNLFFEKIHGSLMLGDTGDRLIEIAASLGIVMLVTGLYMWWPRDQKLSHVLVPDLAARGRPAWKTWHASIGFWFSAIILAFLVTGLAWAGVWGGKLVQTWSTFPAEKWDAVPLSDASHDEHLNHGGKKQVPWGLEQTPMPESGSQAGSTGVDASPDLNAIAALGRSLGIEGRFRVTAPKDEKGVWTLSQNAMSYDGALPTKDRTVHVDQYTGKVLADVRYADYATGAKAMAVGIALHEGQLGLVNFVANVVFCLAIIFLCVSGAVMWWKRRPTRSLGAPLYPRAFNLTWPLGLAVLALALAFPLGGAAILLFALIDYLLPKRLKEAGQAAP